MFNSSSSSSSPWFATAMPSLPKYTLTVQPPMVPFIPDKYLFVVLPVIAYWAYSLFFHYCDKWGYLSQYKLHTPAEFLKKNRVSMHDVIRDVLMQHGLQIAMGIALARVKADSYVGREEYDIQRWAQLIQAGREVIPWLLFVLGLNSKGLAQSVQSTTPGVAQVLAGGQSASLLQPGFGGRAPADGSWEMDVAKIIYWFLAPALQYAAAVFMVDTWQYWIHRAVHKNNWLYRNFHSRHHRLYVPYAFGAVYNHPLAGFIENTVGTVLAIRIAGLDVQQGIIFFTLATLKIVDDHSGFRIPYDPFQMLTDNNAAYHDIHHQSWGMETNFSQPFTSLWDRLTGTIWQGANLEERYERSRNHAQWLVEKDEREGGTYSATAAVSGKA